MNKDFQDFESIYESAARCIAAGIRPSFNIIFAFPGEGPKERRETIDFMMDVCRKFPGAEFWTNIFTPYPGSPILKRTAEIGIETPENSGSLGRLLPALHQASVAPGQGARAPADHARLSAHGLQPHSHRRRHAQAD